MPQHRAIELPDEIAPATAPFGAVQVARPTFPERTVSVADHGALGDGATMNTDAFARAIAACAERGGGHVIVPPGT